MNDYRKLIQNTLLASLIGGLFIAWGYTQQGIIRMAIGGLVILIAFKEAYWEIQYIQELRAWRKQNDGKLLFFYPTTKARQQETEETTLPTLPPDCLRVYYEGPHLVGDVKRSVVLQLMKHHPHLKIHAPSLCRITTTGLQVIM